jgi:hypothetical protein
VCELIYYENQGLPNTIAFTPIPLGLIFQGSLHPADILGIAIGDVGNDGIPDLLVIDNPSAGFKIVYFEGNCLPPAPPCFTLVGNDFNNPFIDITSVTPVSFNKLELLDADCDGDLDVFVANGNFGDPGSAAIWYLENYGGITAPGTLPNIENTTPAVDPFGLTGWLPE